MRDWCRCCGGMVSPKSVKWNNDHELPMRCFACQKGLKICCERKIEQFTVEVKAANAS